MGSKVNVRLWIYASVAVFIAMSIMEFIVSHLILAPAFSEYSILTPKPEDLIRYRLWAYLGRAVFSLAFSFIFTRGYEGKPGIGEGVRYGVWIGALIFIPTLFGNLVMTSLSGGAIVTRCVASQIEGVICGIIVNLVFSKEVRSVTP